MSGRPTFDAGFTTPAMTEIFSAGATVRALLDFEAALAKALADCGVAPDSEAGLVATACAEDLNDPETVLDEWWLEGTPIPALRRAVSANIETKAAMKWFHHGATTQDACDTAASLQSRGALSAIEADLTSMARILRELTVTHRTQPQMGRTFLQDARPTTFGFRTAMWLDAVLDLIDDVRRERSGLTLQLGGPTGTRSDLGAGGPEIVTTVARRLQLEVAVIGWHSNRARILARAHLLQRISSVMAKIATDISMLCSSGIGEIAVRTGGSSSMAGKENPADSVRAIAAAAGCNGAVAMLTAAPPVELDRGVGGWHVEWLALPMAFHTTAAAIEAMAGALASLEVRSDVMTAGVDQDTGADLIAGVDPQIEHVLGRFDQ